MEYTQGEWFAKECSMGQWGIHGESGRDIAVIYDHDEHTEANARLIAKAPQMAAILKEIAEYNVVRRGSDIHNEVRRLLAEIEGR